MQIFTFSLSVVGGAQCNMIRRAIIDAIIIPMRSEDVTKPRF